jgi:hypothetical protein
MSTTTPAPHPSEDEHVTTAPTPSGTVADTALAFPAPYPKGGLQEVVGALLARALLSKAARLPPVLIPDAGVGELPQHGGRHTDPHLQRRTLAQLWMAEGESPQFTAPTHLTELQVWHRGALHVFTGLSAARRLSVIAPSVFSEAIGARRGAVAQAYVGEKLGVRITGSSLARSYAGAMGVPPRDTKVLADRMLEPRWRPEQHKGTHKATRFFNCVVQVFTYFHLQAKRFDRRSHAILGLELVRDMLRVGKNRTVLVEAYLASLQKLLHGNAAAQSPLDGVLLSLPLEERAALWKTQRLFAKDDNDPIVNATAAMRRMTVPVPFSPDDRELAVRILRNYQRRATIYVQANEDLLREHHDRASLHRSSATTFFTRARGGGAAEMHLTVALYRLAHGQSTPLSDVWGITPESLTMEDLLAIMDARHDIRKEINDACSWMLRELDRREISFPYLCIYPEREVKSRCFMILPYCWQQGGYQAATTIGRYLRSREDTREVFAGFDDNRLLAGLKRSVKEGATHFLSLDSSVSTDPLQHELCRMVFEPFYPVFSDYTRAAVERTFAPTRVHTAHERPSYFLERLAFEESLLGSFNVRLSEAEQNSRGDVITSFSAVRLHPQSVPTSIRTYKQKEQLVESLLRYGRVLVEAPTGSGKTVLACTYFNAVVQFPSVVALELMSQYLTTIGKPHNVWHAERKTQPMEWDHDANEPYTILCTSYFVRAMADSYPSMVLVLDEAETKQENYLLNLESTRRKKRRTLLMSATPEELRGEDSTARVKLTGGTNFPIEERTCTYTEMLEMITHVEFPKSLVCVHSEPLCAKLLAAVKAAGKEGIALTARERSKGDYLTRLDSASVVLGTNAIRSSITLPELDCVFDLGRIYESVDFPSSGMESLVLMEASEAMRVQCRGRIGRVKPGTYYRVTDAPGDAVSYCSSFLARAPAITKLSAQISPQRYSRELNHGSIVVERFSQQLLKAAGVRSEPFCPLWASTIRQLCSSHRKELLRTVAFEALGLVNRTRQVAEDLEMKSPMDRFKTASKKEYHLATLDLLDELAKKGWFPAEIAQLVRWGKDLPNDDNVGNHYSPANLLALSLALWRQLARRDGQLLVGIFRNFSTPIPQGSVVVAGGACLVLGLSLHQCAVTARWTLDIPEEIIAHINNLAGSVEELTFAPGTLQGSYPAILGWDAVLKNKGRQRRELVLGYDQYSRAHVFQPRDYERIWKAMQASVEHARVSEVEVTTQGSPMSATASFTVLNSFGLAAHDAIRDGLYEGVQEPLHGAGIFGDDDAVAGSEAAVRADIKGREALGLKTKYEATGIAHFADGGTLRGVTDQLGVFTERLLDLANLRFVPAVKPAGLVRMFHSGRPDELMLSTYTQRPDMLSYEKQLHATDTRWSAMMLENAKQGGLHAIRETTPRRLLSRMFRSRITSETRIAVGDVDRLFANLELLLLQVCPSTRGSPSRQADPSSAVLGHPLISVADARMFTDYLQGEDCHFKLHGPPLKTGAGPWGYEVAAAVLGRDRRNISPADGAACVRLLGWGGEAPPGTGADYAADMWGVLEPLEFGDSRD